MAISQSDIESVYGTLEGYSSNAEWQLGSRKAKLYQGMKPGTDYIGIEGMESFTREGQPQLPGETIKIELPLGIKIKGARIVSGEYVYLDGEYNITPKPEQFKRTIGNRNKGTKFDADISIYTSDDYFPGQWLKVWGGNSNDRGIAHVLIMPLQYNPVEGKMMLLKNATIEVYYEFLNLRRSAESPETDALCIVIGPEEFRSAAFPLIDEHERERIPTEYISTDSIAAYYEGTMYSTDLPYIHRSALPGYHFESYDIMLPMKIIDFLADEAAHPNLEHIIILGDAHIIPPSFYANFGETGYWEYYMPSDFLYASPDYDLIPNYSVSRLPADTPCQAGTMCSRITYYNAAVDDELFANIYFAGGNPFDNIYFDDEMTPNHIINSGNTMGFNVTKSYATRDGFTRDDFIEEWENGEYGMVYEMGHGSGYSIAFDESEDFDTDDILALEPNHFAPIHFAGVCLNGLFDDELISSFDTSMTYAEAMIYAPGGAIALFSATRNSMGTPTYYYDDALLVVESEEYIADMGYRLMQNLNRRPETMGELFINTISSYVGSNDMTDPDNIYTLYEFIFMGDAGMRIPSPPITEPGIPIDISYPEADRSHLDYVVFEGLPGDIISFTPDNYSDRYFIGISRIDYNGYQDTSSSIFWGSSYDLVLDYHSEAKRMDIEDIAGFEERLYFWASGGRMFIDGYNFEWSSTPIAASDEDDFESDYLELTDLYIRDDAENFYFSYPYYAPLDTSRAYHLAIDSKPGGYTGSEEGSDFDHFGNHVFFGDGYEVDFIITAEIWNFLYHDYYSQKHSIGIWEGDNWAEGRRFIGEIGGEIGISSSESPSELGFVEIRLSKSILESYDSVAVILYSTPIDHTGFEYYPAQDAVPSDPATFAEFTEDGHNTLTNFHVYRSGEQISENYSRPENFEIIKAYPNPFNSACRIKSSSDEISIYNIEGQLIEQIRNSDSGSVVWRPKSDLHSGIYIIRDTESSGSVFYIK
ncbi:MAG: C25 family cysteine peptidase [Candidatus Zixiibacteriota bacterium]